MKKRRIHTYQQRKVKFHKSVATYIFTFILMSVLYLKFTLPGFAYFIIILSMAYSLVKKYIDLRHYHKENPELEQPVEEWDLIKPEEIRLRNFESLEKEWKDSDFV